MDKKETLKGKSYWDGSGAYQKEFEKLEEELIPASGPADTVHGKMLRAISRLYYDFCNNGNGNVFEESWGEVSISDFYQEMLEDLEYSMDDTKSFDALESFLQSPEAKDPDFCDKQMAVYDKVVDSVMYQIISESEHSLS